MKNDIKGPSTSKLFSAAFWLEGVFLFLLFLSIASGPVINFVDTFTGYSIELAENPFTSTDSEENTEVEDEMEKFNSLSSTDSSEYPKSLKSSFIMNCSKTEASLNLPDPPPRRG